MPNGDNDQHDQERTKSEQSFWDRYYARQQRENPPSDPWIVDLKAFVDEIGKPEDYIHSLLHNGVPPLSALGSGTGMYLGNYAAHAYDIFLNRNPAVSYVHPANFPEFTREQNDMAVETTDFLQYVESSPSANYLQDLWQSPNLFDKANSMLGWAGMVGTGAAWDWKLGIENTDLKKDTLLEERKINIGGSLLPDEALAGLGYGFTGRSIGYPADVLTLFAGVAQVAKGEGIDPWELALTQGDELDDYAAVVSGMFLNDSYGSQFASQDLSNTVPIISAFEQLNEAFELQQEFAQEYDHFLEQGGSMGSFNPYRFNLWTGLLMPDVIEAYSENREGTSRPSVYPVLPEQSTSLDGSENFLDYFSEEDYAFVQAMIDGVGQSVEEITQPQTVMIDSNALDAEQDVMSVQDALFSTAQDYLASLTVKVDVKGGSGVSDAAAAQFAGDVASGEMPAASQGSNGSSGGGDSTGGGGGSSSGSGASPRVERGNGIAIFADGGLSAGGLALVGEEGPELVTLPAGALVKSASMTRALLPGLASGGGEVNNVAVHVNFQGVADARGAQELVEVLRRELRAQGMDFAEVR